MRGHKDRISKYRIMKPIMILIVITVSFVACGKQINPNPTLTPSPTTAPTLSINVNKPSPTEAIEFDLNEKKEVFYYTVNPDTMETEAVSAMASKEYQGSPEEIMGMVVDTLEDSGYEIGIDQVFIEGTSVIVSFQAGEEPVSGLFEEEEKAILDAIAQSLLDNLEEYNQVSYRINNGAYESDNFSYQIDYIYMKSLK